MIIGIGIGPKKPTSVGPGFNVTFVSEETCLFNCFWLFLLFWCNFIVSASKIWRPVASVCLYNNRGGGRKLIIEWDNFKNQFFPAESIYFYLFFYGKAEAMSYLFLKKQPRWVKSSRKQKNGGQPPKTRPHITNPKYGPKLCTIIMKIPIINSIKSQYK